MRTFCKRMKGWQMAAAANLILLLCIAGCKPAPERPAGLLLPFPAKRVAGFCSDSSRMAQWWPGKVLRAAQWQSPGGQVWRMGQLHSFGSSVQLWSRQDSVEAQLVFLPLNEDSCVVKLVATKPDLRAAQVALLAAEQSTLTSLGSFLNNAEKLYGFKIQEGQMKDSVLMVSKQILPREPGVDDVYRLVEKLRRHCAQHGGVASDSPMVYAQHFSDGWHLQVGLPLARPVPNAANISLRNMVLGNRLFTQVQGGPGRIRSGFEALEAYREDKDLVNPAIPFQILKTNRLAQPDSSRWITELVLPVM